MRKSLKDLKDYLQGPAPSKEWTPRQLTPLHFATAADWLEGVKALLEYGADEYAQDWEGITALDIAISIQSAPLVETLLASNIIPYITNERGIPETTLGPTFMLAAESSNQDLQDVVVDALARQRGQLHGLRPFHDLADIHRNEGYPGGYQVRLFAEKLFSAGFQDVEQYDESGMSPLIVACCNGAMNMASFLLSHGAKPSAEHRDAALRPGHFITYKGHLHSYFAYFGYRSGDKLDHGQEAKLLESAFKTSNRVNSTCRCSPDGFSPLTALYRRSTIWRSTIDSSYSKKQRFKAMLTYLNPQRIDIDRQWRCLVALEVFERLEMTHTCIRHLPTVRAFPEEDRLEIEEEEEELFIEFESIMNEYDQFRGDFIGPTAKCVEDFFDKLDDDLRPLQGMFTSGKIWNNDDTDILGPGNEYQGYWISSSGKLVRYGHHESAGESCLLGSLFD